MLNLCHFAKDANYAGEVLVVRVPTCFYKGFGNPAHFQPLPRVSRNVCSWARICRGAFSPPLFVPTTTCQIMLTRTSNVGVDKLQVANAHPRDARITFDEPTHEYSVDGAVLPKSVTGVLKLMGDDHFKPRRTANRIAGARSPNPRYSTIHADGSVTRMTPREICDQWTQANVLGTDLHGKIERYLNDVDPGPVGPEDPNGPEFAMFLKWYEGIKAAGYVPYRTEWIIFHEEHQVAGSIDCVFYHKDRNEYMIVDWKRCLTSTSGFATAFRDKRFKAPLDHLPATKRNEWALQVNVYRHILEAKYGLTISRMGMVVLHPENTAAVEVWHDPTQDAETLLKAWPTLAAEAPTDSEDDPEFGSESESEAESDGKAGSSPGPGTITTVCGDALPVPKRGGIPLDRLPSGLCGLGPPPARTVNGCFMPFRVPRKFQAPPVVSAALRRVQDPPTEAGDTAMAPPCTLTPPPTPATSASWLKRARVA